MLRITKTFSSLAYLLMIWLSWRWAHNGLDMQFSVGCLFVSGLWLALTRVQLHRLLRTYFDILSRLQMWLPISFGFILSVLAFLSAQHDLVKALAAGSAVGWTYVLIRFLINKKQFEKAGHGPVPKDTWINPPADALSRGTVVLTSGRIAARLLESVGHGEIVVQRPKAELTLFSSYMDRGTTIDDAHQTLQSQAAGGIYIACTPLEPWTDADNQLAWDIANAMLRENIAWKDGHNAWWSKTIEKLPVPKGLKPWLLKKTHATGYDWLGLYFGRRMCNRWTCIAACQELIWRMGRKMRWLGTGMLGLGTGILDPIMPDRFIAEPSYRLLTLADKVAYEARIATANGAQQTATK
ncbi:MAG TPA: hypothetical protein V6C81_31675 [Planktothrix sp.]|jgi:hypothetical protein